MTDHDKGLVDVLRRNKCCDSTKPLKERRKEQPKSEEADQTWNINKMVLSRDASCSFLQVRLQASTRVLPSSALADQLQSSLQHPLQIVLHGLCPIRRI